jgi:hypothetical protein
MFGLGQLNQGWFSFEKRRYINQQYKYTVIYLKHASFYFSFLYINIFITYICGNV